LEKQLRLPVFEIPTLPPSIPGMRLHSLLVNAIEQSGGRVYDGMQVLSAQVDGGKVQAVWSEAASRQKRHRAKSYILATGGILGGGARVEAFEGAHEVIFGLPLTNGAGGERDIEPDFFYPYGHPIFRVGVKVNPNFQPVSESGERLLENLYVAGAALAGCDPIQERSVEGIALASGYTVGSAVGSAVGYAVGSAVSSAVSSTAGSTVGSTVDDQEGL
jgi:glycerol-3-phosphate dehydrogenase subunit B